MNLLNRYAMTLNTSALLSLVSVLSLSFLPSVSAQERPFRLAAGPQSSVFAALVSAQLDESSKLAKPEIIVGTTAEGFSAFCRPPSPETVDIILSSREMTRTEEERCAQAGVRNIIEGQLGYFAQVLLQKIDEPPLSLTTNDIYRAFAAVIPSAEEFKSNATKVWNDLNVTYPKSAIRLFITSTAQGSRRVFDFEAMADGCRNVPQIREIFGATQRTTLCTNLRKDVVVEDDSTPNRLEALKKAPAGALLLTSYDVYLENQVWTRLVPINGVRPSPEAVVQEDYTLTTPLFIIAKGNLFRSLEGQNSSLFPWLTEAFSERAIGNNGYLVKSGLMPLSLSKREAGRSELKKLNN